MRGLTIGKLAAGAGVGVETVRFYQRRGLLALPERDGSGFREYSQDDQRRLAFIRRAGRLGFTLGEIGDLLGAGESGSADDIARAAGAKLAAISQQISDLAELQCRLRRLVRVCERGDSGDCMALQLGDAAPPEHDCTEHDGPGPDGAERDGTVTPEPAGMRITMEGALT